MRAQQTVFSHNAAFVLPLQAAKAYRFARLVRFRFMHPTNRAAQFLVGNRADIVQIQAALGLQLAHQFQAQSALIGNVLLGQFAIAFGSVAGKW